MANNRQCPFYIIDKNTMFSYEDHCAKTGRSIAKTTYDMYCNAWESGYSKCPNFQPDKDPGGCYLTSACVEAMGLCDCCNELTTLRRFRDNWLANQPNGQAEINEYYQIAPTIVERIHSKPNSLEILKELYETLIVPCVEHIQAGRNEAAHELYRASTISLKETYCID